MIDHGVTRLSLLAGLIALVPACGVAMDVVSIEGLRSPDVSARDGAARAIRDELVRLDAARDPQGLHAAMDLLRAAARSADSEESQAARNLLAPYLAGGELWRVNAPAGSNAVWQSEGVLLFGTGKNSSRVTLLSSRTGKEIWGFETAGLERLQMAPPLMRSKEGAVFLGCNWMNLPDLPPNLCAFDIKEGRSLWEERGTRQELRVQILEPTSGGLFVKSPSEERFVPEDEEKASEWELQIQIVSEVRMRELLSLRNPATGKVLWRKAIDDVSIWMAVPWKDGMLLAGMKLPPEKTAADSCAGWLAHMSLKDGSILSEMFLPGGISIGDMAVTRDGILFFEGGPEPRAGLVRLDRESGKWGIVWTRKIGTRAHLISATTRHGNIGVPEELPGFPRSMELASKPENRPDPEKKRKPGFFRCLPEGILVGEPTDDETGVWRVCFLDVADGAVLWTDDLPVPRGILIREVDRDGILCQRKGASREEVEFVMLRLRDADRE